MPSTMEVSQSQLQHAFRTLAENVKGITLEEALFVPTGGFRSIPGTLKHAAGWSHVYRSYAFDTSPRRWAQLDWPRGLRDTVDKSQAYVEEVVVIGVTHMILPDYWVTRPSVNFDESTQSAFDALLNTTLSIGGCPTIQYTLPWPKWQFLCHLADHHDIALHGSGDPHIALFEPRQSNDLNEFGSQKAVYAASDGLWAMFFAIVDRDRTMSITNACVRLADETGTLHGPFYVFSVSQSALPSQPWRTGTVYLLPRNTFTVQPLMAVGSDQVHIAQLASFVPVQPLAKLTVTPADFPFLMQIRGHDDRRLQEYATALQTGAPWPNDL